MPPRLPNDNIIELSEILRGPQEPPPDGMGGEQISPSSWEFDEGAEMAPQSFEVDADGNVHEVMPEDDLMPVMGQPGHHQNLAEMIDEEALSNIADELIERIEDDIESREPWTDRFRRGMEMLGLVDDEMDDGPFPGASTSVMPVMSEAIVNFWARAMGEQVPSEGPCKAALLGKPTQMQMVRADRVASYMNHEMMFLDRSWYSDHSRLLFALPYSGSCFKKVFRDHELGRNCSIYVPAEDFITNYTFSDLDSSPRYTHRFWRTRNEIRKAQVAGLYRDVDLQAASSVGEDMPEETQIKLEVNDFEVQDNTDDARHEIFECHCELDIPGFEDFDETGYPTGVALPYVVTIDRESEKILSIYRAWKDQDPLKRRRVVFTKYDYIPGPGFYGLGLFHLIGGLQQAATGALRAIIDGAATASLQGGFMSKDASMRDQDLTIEPGVWKQVDASLEDLSKAFFSPPFKEPSPVLFNIMGFLVERSEKFTATTEMMTGGQDSKNAPVGSTLALLEQGGKVFSAIHRGLHKSLGDELRQRFDLIQEYMPIEGYPYDVEGAHEGIMADDFAPGISIVPVSDPNIFSQAQRVAINQMVYELATANPDLVDRKVAVKRLLEGMKVPEFEELLITQEPPPPMDPISEIQAILRGEPVQAYPEQNHQAHIAVLKAFVENPQFGGNPQVGENVGPALMALIGQHLAYLWAVHARAQGVPAQMLPPPMQPDPSQQGQMGAPQENPMGQMGMQPGPQGGVPMGAPPEQVPPEQIAQMAAQIAPQLAQVPGLAAPQAEAEAAKAQAETQLLQSKVEGEQIKNQSAQQKAQLEAGKTISEVERKGQEAQQKAMLEQIKAAQQMEIETLKAETKLEIERMQAALKAQEAEAKRQTAMFEAFQKARESEAQLQEKMITSNQEQDREEREAAVDAAIKVAEVEADERRKDQESQTRQSVAKTQAKAAAKKAGRKKKGDT